MNKTLWVFILCFIAPVVFALMALKFSWLEPAQTNYGQFLNDEKIIANWPENQHTKWSLVAINQQVCEKACLSKKQLIKNVFEVLGKHNLYVGAYSLNQQNDSLKLNDLVSSEELTHDLAEQSLTMNSDAIYLVDHRGLVVLQYPVTYQERSDNDMKRGLIKDLKKLLNYSRSRA